jgi:hypothetical protein
MAWVSVLVFGVLLVLAAKYEHKEPGVAPIVTTTKVRPIVLATLGILLFFSLIAALGGDRPASKPLPAVPPPQSQPVPWQEAQPAPWQGGR